MLHILHTVLPIILRDPSREKRWGRGGWPKNQKIFMQAKMIEKNIVQRRR